MDYIIFCWNLKCYDAQFHCKLKETDRELLFLAIRFPRLHFQHQQATRSQLLIHPTECALETNVAVVEMNPLCNAQAENHVILFTLLLQLPFRPRHIVTLDATEQTVHWLEQWSQTQIGKLNLYMHLWTLCSIHNQTRMSLMCQSKTDR